LTLSDIRKYPAILTVLPLTAGILLGSLLKPVVSNTYLLASLVLLLLIGIKLYLKLLPRFSNNKLLTAYLIIILFFGIGRCALYENSSQNKQLDDLLSGEREQNAIIHASVIEQPEITDNQARILIETDSISSPGDTLLSHVKILCNIYRNKYKESAPENLRLGDMVTIQGKLKQLPHKKNPGEFDYGRYLKIHGIDAILTSYGFDNVRVTGCSDPGFYNANIIYPVRNYCSNVIDKYIGGNEGEFLKGLVIGERSGITKQAKEDFVNAGVAHIIAVSGLNVAYILICITLLLTFVPLKYKYKVFISILFLVFYMNLTGNVPSIVRAVIMASVFLLSRLLERKPNPYSIISFAALVVLVINPSQLFDAGFLLSFSAVISIVLLYPRLEKILSRFINLEGANGFAASFRIILSYLLVTLSAFVGLLPIIAIMFERVSLISIITNLIVVPFSNLVLGIGFLLILVSLVSGWLASVIASTASAILYGLLWFINYTAGFDLSYVETYGFDTLLFFTYYLFIYLILTTNKINYKARFALFVLLIANFFLFDSILSRKEQLRIACLDTGKSSSTLISIGGFNALIDAGASGMNYNSAERTVIPYLKRQRIDNIDLLILTDLDFSEYSNLVYFILNFPVTRAILPSYSESLFENDFVKSVFKNIDVKFSDGDFSSDNSQGIRLVFKDGYVECIYENVRFVFSEGDMKAGERADVLQVLDAGTFENYSPSFISHLNPAIVVTSHASGRSSRQYEVFKQTLRSVGINLIDLPESGAAIFESDGKKIWRVIWR